MSILAETAKISHMSGRNLDAIKHWLDEGSSGRMMSERFTAGTDRLVREIFLSVGPQKHVALMATGGYGRGEMAPFSDVDLMFLAKDRKETGATERVLYKLWDTGLDISHSFRTPEECIEESFRDIKTRTSLLEARYIAGDRELFETFRRRVYPQIAHKKQKDFIRQKLQEMEKRHLASGDSVYLLEPHIKEGEGGLRDIHTALWLSKVALRTESLADFSGLIGSDAYRRFLSAYDFLLRVRFALHLESRRKNDILSFEYQKNVAQLLGFNDSRKFRGSERMLRYYYLKSRIVKEQTANIVVKCSKTYVNVFRDLVIRKISDEFSISGGSLIVTKKALFRENPDKIMEVFFLFSQTGKKLSHATKEMIRANLLRISHGTRSSPAAVRHFLEILKGPRIYETLREMHELGVLGRFVPEFGALHFLVVHEPYHMYTVDEHTLMAIMHLEALRATKYKNLEDLQTIFSGMERVDSLFMALLFHDIGKAAGRRHEEEGYKRLKNILTRFNFEVKKRKRIEFLVRNHILMSNLAMRRETTDTEVIADFADAVGDTENLRAIYLITYADMSAVHPGFWNAWKAYLLRELFDQTFNYLSGIREDGDQYIRSLQALSPKSQRRALLGFIEEMPERYLLSTTKERVIEDQALVMQAGKEGFAMRIDIGSGVAEVTVSAEDRPGLFSRIVGFLSSKGLNIVSGKIFTGRQGIVIDRIAVSNWKEIWWEGLAADLEGGLRDILAGGKPLAVTRREKKAGSLFDIFIELDNEASEEFSLIEIFSPDRMGLLYDISDVMYRNGINIVSARINTEAGLAQDIFYVQWERAKINYNTAERLLSELWQMLQ
jgi:[protein-PII] uridylyltransferase